MRRKVILECKSHAPLFDLVSLYLNVSKSFDVITYKLPRHYLSGKGNMKKIISTITILLVTISSAKAQSEFGEAANHPVLVQATTALYSCEEGIVRENLFIPKRDEKKCDI